MCVYLYCPTKRPSPLRPSSGFLSNISAATRFAWAIFCSSESLSTVRLTGRSLAGASDLNNRVITQNTELVYIQPSEKAKFTISQSNYTKLE